MTREPENGTASGTAPRSDQQADGVIDQESGPAPAEEAGGGAADKAASTEDAAGEAAAGGASQAARAGAAGSAAGEGAAPGGDAEPDAAPGGGEADSPPGELEELRRALDEAQARQRELEDQYLRLRAEFENFRRRTRREAEEMRVRAAEGLIRALLPVVDNLERALRFTRAAENAPASLVEGVEMVLRQLMTELERAGLRPIEAVGQPFDPTRHEAVVHEETSEHPDGHVIEELQRGYALGDKVLRPSMVKVAKGLS